MRSAARLVNDLEAIFLDDGIGQNFFGDALELLLGFVAVPAVEIQNKELSLANVFHGRVAEAGKRVMDSLSLRIEDRALWHHPDVCFHASIIAKPSFRRGGRSGSFGCAQDKAAPLQMLGPT